MIVRGRHFVFNKLRIIWLFVTLDVNYEEIKIVGDLISN